MITYRIDATDVRAHLYRVTLTVPTPAAEQRLSLPVWIPGSYLVREFARHLSSLVARQGGREVPMRQLDKATWLAARLMLPQRRIAETARKWRRLRS